MGSWTLNIPYNKWRNLVQAAQYSHTNTHTKVVQLDYTYTHLWCGAHTVLGSCTFKLESNLYNCTLGSANNTSGTNIFESAQIWVSYSVFVETSAHTLLRPNIWQYTETVEDGKCFYNEYGPPSDTCWSAQPSSVHSVYTCCVEVLRVK